MSAVSIASRSHLTIVVLTGFLTFTHLASAQDGHAMAAPHCGSGTYFSDWPSQAWDYALLSKITADEYSATVVVTKDGPCKPCHYTTDERYGPISLPVGRYTEYNGKLMYWGGRAWIAVGYSPSALLGRPELRAYDNVLLFHSVRGADGKGYCVSTQIAGIS